MLGYILLQHFLFHSHRYYNEYIIIKLLLLNVIARYYYNATSR